jgi:hypothetical protein
MVTEDKHVDAYGQMFLYSNQVVISKYFKQQGRSLYSYVHYDISETYIYSHMIRAVKFQMIQSSHRQKWRKSIYQLSKIAYLSYNL